jgi:hypothetical protein
LVIASHTDVCFHFVLCWAGLLTTINSSFAFYYLA